MNEGARQANQKNYEQSISWKLARIIELLEKIARLLPEPPLSPDEKVEEER